LRYLRGQYYRRRPTSRILPSRGPLAPHGAIGMAFGLGFIFGPILGGLSLRYLGNSGPGWWRPPSARNFLLACLILAESRKPSSEPVQQRPHLEQCCTLEPAAVGCSSRSSSSPRFASVALKARPVLVSDNFQLDIQRDETSATTSFISLRIAALLGLVQGGHWPARKAHGEPKLIALSLFLTASLRTAALPKRDLAVVLGVLFDPKAHPGFGCSCGWSAFHWMLLPAPLFGMLSNLTSANEQGATIGVARARAASRAFSGQSSPPRSFTGALPCRTWSAR